MDESCEVPFVFHGKVGRIALAQQAYVAGDPRSQHRDSHAQGLAHHVGAAFHARADDHRVAGSEPGKRAAVRHAAEPAIARVALHRRERLSAERFVEGGAKVNDLNGAEMRQRGDDPQWILLLAQMADHANAELPGDRILAQGGGAALHDHAHFAPQRRGQLRRRHRLQRDQPVGQRERFPRLAGDANVAVDVGAGQRDEQPPLRIVNPPRWELGHVGWFQEFWCLRRGGRESILPNADALYNSATVAHDKRWILPLPSFPSTLEYRDEVLRRVIERVRAGGEADLAYFARLATRHEDMHAEAFHYTRQTLGYPAPQLPAPGAFPGNRVPGGPELPGGRYQPCARPARPEFA